MWELSHSSLQEQGLLFNRINGAHIRFSLHNAFMLASSNLYLRRCDNEWCESERVASIRYYFNFLFLLWFVKFRYVCFVWIGCLFSISFCMFVLFCVPFFFVLKNLNPGYARQNCLAFGLLSISKGCFYQSSSWKFPGCTIFLHNCTA